MYGIIFRGMAVGMTETVPGVSGSTVAMILGIYERLIYSLSILTTKERRKAYTFLFLFGIGMFVGFVISLFLIDFLLENYRAQTLTFFIGIIFGFLPFLWGETITLAKGKLTLRHYLIVLFFLCLVIFGQLLGEINTIDISCLTFSDYLFFIIAGFIASTALVLPGISGALILTIFGIYELAKDALLALHMPVVLTIGFGILLGVLLSSKLIRYLLLKYQVETYAAMVGLVSGSIFAILNNMNVSLDLLTGLFSLITFVGGIFASVMLTRVQLRQA